MIKIYALIPIKILPEVATNKQKIDFCLLVGILIYILILTIIDTIISFGGIDNCYNIFKIN